MSEDLTGQTFGHLVVVGPARIGPMEKPDVDIPTTGWWAATCTSCGRQMVAPEQAIRRGRPCSYCLDVEAARAAEQRFAATHSGTPGYMGSGWRP
jgi:hypothetical protein